MRKVDFFGKDVSKDLKSCGSWSCRDLGEESSSWGYNLIQKPVGKECLTYVCTIKRARFYNGVMAMGFIVKEVSQNL